MAWGSFSAVSAVTRELMFVPSSSSRDFFSLSQPWGLTSMMSPDLERMNMESPALLNRVRNFSSLILMVSSAIFLSKAWPKTLEKVSRMRTSSSTHERSLVTDSRTTRPCGLSAHTNGNPMAERVP